MGRKPRALHSFRVVAKKDKGNFYVRGTYKGFRLDTSTGESDEERAHLRAAQMWSEHILWVESGRAQTVHELASGEQLAMATIGAAWAQAKGDRRATQEGHAHRIGLLATFFPSVADCNTDSVERFIQLRLQQVQRDTVMKDQRVLRSILRFAKTEGLLHRVPTWDLPERAVRGKRHRRGRAQAEAGSPQEVEQILALVPTITRNQRFPARAACRFLWETGLRPGLLWRITSPRHWDPGRSQLRITSDVSKIGWSRVVPLTEGAQGALLELHRRFRGDPGAEISPGEFLLAPAWDPQGVLKEPDLRKALLGAAVKVLGEERGTRFSASSFRPSRITQLLTDGHSPAKVGFMVGQTSSSIQDRYLRVNERHVEDFWEARIGA